MSWRCLKLTLAFASLFAAGIRPGWAAEVPPRSEGGQTLVVPEQHLELGEVYHVTPGEDTQLLCTSDAPLQRIVSTSCRVVGYVVTPFEVTEEQPPLLAGAFRVPTAAIKSGLGQFDEVVQGSGLLNAAVYPEITFRLVRVAETRLVSAEDGRKSFTLTVLGELTIRDKTVALEIPTRLELVPFTWRTMARNVGELLILRGKFDLKLADLQMQKPGPFKDRIADTIGVDVFLLCNTMSPEKNLDPQIKKVHHLKQLQFLTLLRDFNDPDQGYEFGRAFLREIWDDAQALNRLAWAVLTEEGIATRDVNFALRAAERANALTAHKEPALLHTLARACYDKGDLTAALKWLRLAVEQSEKAPATAAELRAVLERYEKEAEKGRQ